jgi:C1A family cysteine protease
MPGHAFGWHPSVPDIRDYPMALAAAPASLPAKVDLRPQMPPIGDQGQLGSCTAWASTAAYRYELDKQKLADFEPSELAQYYWTRALEGTTASDAGASIRDSVKALAKTGAAAEKLWPYDISKFNQAPPNSVKQAASHHLALQYQSVPQNLTAVKSALAAGFPVLIGISVYASFESDPVARTGVVPMPTPREQLLGGHALLLVGYDDATQRFTTRNSWGTGFGDHGYVYLPYAYVTSPQLASDFWIIKRVD